MSWSQSGWGNSGWNKSWGNDTSRGVGWGSSGFSGSKKTKSLVGQHKRTCESNSGFSSGGPMSTHYNERCDGCKRDRALAPWGTNGFGK